MTTTERSPCEIEIVAAALDRAQAQAWLEKGAQELEYIHSMRERQAAVDEADRRISTAANTMLAAGILAPILR